MWLGCQTIANLLKRYVKNILKSTSKSVDQVTIQPDSKWELHTRKEPVNPSRSSGVASDSDDDLIEITKSGDSIRMSAPRSFKTPVSMASQQSREPSASSGPPRDPPNTGSTSSKRTISAVIDLTSSGDEDDEPIARPPKRPMTNGYGTPSNVPTYRPAPMPPVNGLPPRPI